MSRNYIPHLFQVLDEIHKVIPISELVSGNAHGPDRWAEVWATQHNIPITRYYPDWNKYGKSAGVIRNLEMLNHISSGGCLVSVWDGSSKGTKWAMDMARRRKIPIVRVREYGALQTGFLLRIVQGNFPIFWKIFRDVHGPHMCAKTAYYSCQYYKVVTLQKLLILQNL